MEVYLNIAETGLGTYGVNAGAQRYFDKDASNLSRSEAARIAAVLPLPKRREAIAPSGFTRRYGNSIAARIGVVARDDLDSCVYGDGDRVAAVEPPEPARRERPKKAEQPAPEPVEPVEQAPAEEPPTEIENVVVEFEPAAPPPPPPEPVEVNGM